MSSLVSDFLINPVLRQARRFSRSSATGDQPDPSTNPQPSTRSATTNHEASIHEGTEGIVMASAVEDSMEVVVGVSGEPIVSTPEEEDGGLDAQLATMESQAVHSRSVPDIDRNSIPYRAASYRSDTLLIDDEMTDNPSFGTPGQFQNDAPRSSFSSLSRTHPSSRMSPAPSRRSTQETVQRSGSSSTRPRNSSLPEDDGMSALRRRIVAIQSMQSSAEEKARLMHQLLTEGYTQSQIGHNAKNPLPARSPTTTVSQGQERTLTPLSLSSFNFWQTASDTVMPVPPSTKISVYLSPEDLTPTFMPPPPPAESPESPDATEEPELEAVPALGCKHYKRNVKLQCSTCEKWYTCRLCHDEAEEHILIRTETKNMLCMICGCAQRAGENCVGCGERAAWYYCNICKLWDDDASKSIYHCDDCGICRIGRGLGKDFFHCKTCGLCMSISMEESHKCIERSTDCDCPICGEYMFTSPQTVVFMRCGHTIHRNCYYAHLKSSYKCPICSQSVVNMETQFRNLDRAIEGQPMPPQFQDTKAMVSCNDCRAKSAVKYHWLGLKCAICDSYNTAQLSIITDPEVPSIEVAESVDEAEMEADALAGLLDNNAPPRPAGPARIRRHSSHIRGPSGDGNSLRFSPYPLPQRMGRSVSPLRGMGRFGDEMDVDESTALTDDDEEDLDFWGRTLSAVNLSTTTAEEEDEEEEEDSDMSDIDEGDDGDEPDRMELFGHR